MTAEYNASSAGSKPSGPFAPPSRKTATHQSCKWRVDSSEGSALGSQTVSSILNISHFQSKHELRPKKKGKKVEPSLLYKTSISSWVFFFFTLNRFEDVTAFSILEVWQLLSRWCHHFEVTHTHTHTHTDSRSCLYANTDCRVQKSHPPWPDL